MQRRRLPALFPLIADLGPTRALTVTFLIPAFGMLWGILFLDERITGLMALGCALIVSGTWLVARGGVRVRAAVPARTASRRA